MLGTVSNFALLRALLDPPQREKVPEAILLFWVCSLLGWQVVVPLADWLGLRAVGAPVRFRDCFKSAGYATAPLLLGLVPCVGLSLSPICAVVLRLVLLRATTTAGWKTVVVGSLIIPTLLVSAAIAFRWDMALW